MNLQSIMRVARIKLATHKPHKVLLDKKTGNQRIANSLLFKSKFGRGERI